MNHLQLLTDTELVLAYQNKQNNIYFGELYKRFNPKIYRYCMQLLKDQEMASDATQDIFYKISSRLLKLKYPVTFSNWLYKVAHNHCMDQLKKRNYNYSILDYKIHEIENIDYDFETDSTREIQINQLKQFLNTIPVEEKELLEAKYLDKKSIIDLMSIYKLSESAVKMRLSRARQKVKKLFGNNQLVFAQ